MTQYNDEMRMLRDTMKRFVDEQMPRESAARWDEESIYPTEAVSRLAELGVMGLTIPEEYGGTGRNIPAAIAVVEELSRRSLAVAVPYIMSSFYAGMNLLECGSEEQKHEMLPRIARGELQFAFGVTEPDVGGDVASVRTHAVRRNNKVVVNGMKRFITGANVADYIYTLARTDSDGPRYKNLSIIMIPRDAPGIEIEKMESIGMRGGAYTCDVRFEDVEVDASLIVGGDDGWNRGWPMIVGPGLDVERIEVAAMALGLAEGALEDAWNYSQERNQFGAPISAHQAVRHKLADAKADVLACRLMIYHAAEMAQDRQDCSVESAMAKLFVSERARNIILDAQFVMGAYGCVKGFNMERYVRDILIFPIVGGSSNIQRNNIANGLRLKRA